jgi:hypothetical protein
MKGLIIESVMCGVFSEIDVVQIVFRNSVFHNPKEA